MRSSPLSPGPPDEQRDHRPGRGLERCTGDASPTSTRQVSYPVRRPKLPEVTCGTGWGGGRTTVGLARVWTESRRDSQDELTSRPGRTGPRNGPTGARAMIARCGTRTSAGSSSRPSGAAPKHAPTERTQKGSGVAGPSVRSPGEGASGQIRSPWGASSSTTRHGETKRAKTSEPRPGELRPGRQAPRRGRGSPTGRATVSATFHVKQGTDGASVGPMPVSGERGRSRANGRDDRGRARRRALPGGGGRSRSCRARR